MIRLCGLLVWVALNCAVKIAAESLVRLWLAIRPIRRFRAWRAMRSWRREHGGQPDEIREPFHSDEDPQEGAVSEQMASVIRSVLKSAGGGLVGAGLVTSGELEVLAGAAAVLVGLAWSWWVKREAE